MSAQPIRPEPVEGDVPRRHFQRGRQEPRGVVWFGARSFWGHLRHFIASAIATEDVDSRDWMAPDGPQRLADRIANHLEGAQSGGSLIENLGEDLWIDFVADTGDDAEISEAVAGIVFQDYEVPDPDNPESTLLAPRGSILLFGGDTAYPVATSEEIHNRVIVPFNRVLEARRDGKRRVLIGIPGNHDWYDGLDGFGRMFRRRFDDDEQVGHRPSVIKIERNPFEGYAEWARKFVKGGHIEKVRILLLDGYTTVQRASFWALPLTPNVHVFAVDRQLKHLDFRQRRYFRDWRREHPEVALVMVMPDPIEKFGKPSNNGEGMRADLDLDLTREGHLILTGDIHHYERWTEGPTTQVIAGGGGAFLHPAPIARRPKVRRAVEWPGPRQSKELLFRVPWKVARGRSGFLPHWVFLALLVPITGLRLPFGVTLEPQKPAPFVMALVLGASFAMIGGVRKSKDKAVWALALSFASLAAGLSVSVRHLATLAEAWLPGLPFWANDLIALSLCVYLSALLFGFYLSLLTLWGLEHTQAFTALDHPGYKHFLRLRVRKDGNAIDFFCIGKEDPLGEGQKPVLIDYFSWRPGEPPSPPPGKA